MIEIEQLGLEIKKKQLLYNINLKIEDGSIFGIIGDNGSGKTLLLKCISGLIPYTSGRIQVDDKVIGRDIEFPEDMGIMIETPQFIPYLSGIHNLELLASYKDKVKKEEIKACMIQVGLNPDERKMVKKYSLGMRQRLGIAQAIMEKPKLLILDEPFNSIDKKGVMHLRELLLKRKKQDTIMIITSHNAYDIEYLCDDIYELK